VIVLGLDTATRSSAVALRTADGHTLQARDDPGPGAHPGHATRLLSMTSELLVRARVRWGGLERIAVGVGPGRFTGLRVGIATARGLAQSLPVELVGVSSLRTLAEAVAPRCSEQEIVLSVIDARRGQVFAAAYATATAGQLRELESPRALRPEELAGAVRQIDELHGAGASRWLAIGDGAVLYRGALEDAGVAVAGDGSPEHLIDARVVCELATRLAPAGTLEQVVPDYRRAPDAQLARGHVALAGGSAR